MCTLVEYWWIVLVTITDDDRNIQYFLILSTRACTKEVGLHVEKKAIDCMRGKKILANALGTSTNGSTRQYLD
jgi:hypothetical protein